MQENMGLPFKHVSETAYLVAAFRAMESRRPDALFHDPLADKLLDANIQKYVGHVAAAQFGEWMLAIRTYLLDHLLQDYLQKGVTTIVNLAAGLDTRPYRLTLPESLEWVEVDLPGIIDYKNAKLADEKPNCNLRRISVDLQDQAARQRLLNDIANPQQKTLVITEGLLCYLLPAQIATLAADLLAQPHIHWWAMDIMTEKFFHASHSAPQHRVKQDQVSFQFAPADAEAFFTPLGWPINSFRSFIETSEYLQRPLPDTFDAWRPKLDGLMSSGIGVLRAQR